MLGVHHVPCALARAGGIHRLRQRRSVRNEVRRHRERRERAHARGGRPRPVHVRRRLRAHARLAQHPRIARASAIL